MCPTKAFKIIAFLLFYFLCGTDAVDSCQTPNGESAKCVSVYECPILLNAIPSASGGQIEFLRKSQCGYSKAPLVCCGSSNNYVTTTKISQNPSKIPDRRVCGFQETDRVFGGEDTALDEFPWMALIQYERKNGRKYFGCGGALISQRYVLTAAHCIMGEILNVVGNPYVVRLGEWNTNTTEDCISVQSIKLCNPAPEDVRIERVIAHENYSNDINRHNDIGLIKLARDIIFSNSIRPICLPLPNESSRVGEQLYIAGWGQTLTGSRSSIKQKLNVPMAKKSRCARKFSEASVTLDHNQICAGGEKNKDSCRGDSGGPLMAVTRSDPSQWYVEGIVSFGTDCGTEGWPGIYTKVSSYLSWINRNVV